MKLAALLALLAALWLALSQIEAQPALALVAYSVVAGITLLLARERRQGRSNP